MTEEACSFLDMPIKHLPRTPQTTAMFAKVAQRLATTLEHCRVYGRPVKKAYECESGVLYAFPVTKPSDSGAVVVLSGREFKLAVPRQDGYDCSEVYGDIGDLTGNEALVLYPFRDHSIREIVDGLHDLEARMRTVDEMVAAAAVSLEQML